MTHFIAGDEPIIFASEMELRDHFAANVLQAIINADDWFANAGHWKDEKTMFKTYAHEAYKFADAMMQERDK